MLHKGENEPAEQHGCLCSVKAAPGEWRCSMNSSGALCVTTAGAELKPALCAGSWAVGQLW